MHALLPASTQLGSDRHAHAQPHRSLPLSLPRFAHAAAARRAHAATNPLCNPHPAPSSLPAGGKLMCIARRLKSLADGKAVVATTFASLLPLARQAFGAAGVDAVVLQGSPAERAAVVQQFQTQPATRVLLLAVGTDCAGLTL